MHPGALRLLCVLLAPAAAMASASVPISARAASAPAPYIIAIDAGHGGAPDNSNPHAPYDSGVIGVNGLLEKDVTLDIAKRVQAQLTALDVTVVMTRTSDVFRSILDREQTATDNGAQYFVSIHCNGFTDGSAEGTLVLFPTDVTASFAGHLSTGVGTGLVPYGINDDGPIFYPDLWTHLTVPTATVEVGYLTNPHDAAELAQEGVKAAAAQGIVAGILSGVPDITARKTAIDSWDSSHAVVASSSPKPIVLSPELVAGLALFSFLGLRYRGAVKALFRVVFFVLKVITWPIRVKLRSNQVELTGKRQETLARSRSRR